MVPVDTEDVAGAVEVSTFICVNQNLLNSSFGRFIFLGSKYLGPVCGRVVTKASPVVSRPGPELESRLQQLLEPGIQPELWLRTAKLRI